MSVHEVAWRVTSGRRSILVRSRSEAARLAREGASIRPVSFEVHWREELDRRRRPSPAGGTLSASMPKSSAASTSESA